MNWLKKFDKFLDWVDDNDHHVWFYPLFLAAFSLGLFLAAFSLGIGLIVALICKYFGLITSNP